MLVAIVKLVKILQQKGGSALFFFIVFELLRVMLIENESKCFVQKNARILFLHLTGLIKQQWINRIFHCLLILLVVN